MPVKKDDVKPNSLVELVDDLRKVLALNFGDTELKSSGLARTVTACHGSCTPGRSTSDLAHTHDLPSLVAERDEDDAVVGEEGESGQGGDFLSTVLGRSAADDSGELACESLLHPELTGGIEEGAPLTDGATVTGRDTEDVAIVLAVETKIGWLVRKIEAGAFKVHT
jgi:hypothetical protein